MDLAINEEEHGLLVDLVQSRVSELHPEIRRCMDHNFKDGLKQELACFERLLERLRALCETSSAVRPWHPTLSRLLSTLLFDAAQRERLQTSAAAAKCQTANANPLRWPFHPAQDGGHPRTNPHAVVRLRSFGLVHSPLWREDRPALIANEATVRGYGTGDCAYYDHSLSGSGVPGHWVRRIPRQRW